MKIYIILELASLLAGFIMLYCLLGGAIILAGMFLWTSLMLGGISMSMEANDVVANMVVPIKSLHDWK